MLELPPPQEEIVKPPVECVQEVECAEPCYYFPAETVKKVAQDDEMVAYAKELSALYEDGFQWEDLFSMARLSIEFMVKYVDMSAQEKRDGAVRVINYVIDITDTPYLPDSITDPLCKAMVPPFVDVVIFYLNGEFSDTADIDNVYVALQSIVAGEFAWENFFSAVSLAINYYVQHIDKEYVKDAVYEALATIIDETSWPYCLDLILDPLMKALIPSVINLAIDAI